MQVYEKERQLQREVATTVEGRLPDVEVLAAELSGPERLTVYIDHPAGVDHALCEQVTDVLRSYLDRYTLDVSSPGLERPLRTPAHFADVVGRRAAVRTSHEVAGRKRFRGEVVSADEREVTLATGDEQVRIPYEAIARGNLIDEG
jgi:ribosome maturation factor RimP